MGGISTCFLSVCTSPAKASFFSTRVAALTGIISLGHLRSCQSAAILGDKNGSFAGEVHTDGKRSIYLARNDK